MKYEFKWRAAIVDAERERVINILSSVLVQQFLCMTYTHVCGGGT